MSSHNEWNPWWVAGAALVLAGSVLLFARGRPARVGDSARLSITVIPADAMNLECSSNERFGAIHCAFDAAGKPLPGPLALHPYVTTGRELVLLSGVFEDPAVGLWLGRARQTGNSARVTVNCQADLLGRVSTIAVRWQAGASWGMERGVPVAKVRECRITP